MRKLMGLAGFWLVFSMVGIAMQNGTCGQTFQIQDKASEFDRWFYPPNTTPGIRSAGSLFSGDETVDDRFGQVVVGFDTSVDVPAGSPAGNYIVSSAKVTLTTASDAVFFYDPTYDPVASYVDPSMDVDAGRPATLFGAQLRNGFVDFGFGPTDVEDDIFQEQDDFGPESIGTRNVFPVDQFHPTARDVSNNVRDGFDVQPWAIGTTDQIPAGAEVPFFSSFDFEFELDLNNSEVSSYLQSGLQDGKLFFVATSLTETAEQAPSGFPKFWLREGMGLPGFQPPRLDLTVELVQSPDGDFDDDGTWGTTDIDMLTAEIAAMTNANSFDLTGDGLVDADDLDAWLVEGGAMNPAQTSGNAFLVGDANLDGVVDGLDFIAWNDSKFVTSTEWTRGNFVPDTAIDGQDFIAWNDFKFQMSDVTAVPEPSALIAVGLLASFLALRRR